ncbi:MAG: hypothetical protein J2P58_03545 [Acidimicrobiaceae bacterium]|nr:hypothetical protein [Acidimicrobiaceae bacterium]
MATIAIVLAAAACGGQKAVSGPPTTAPPATTTSKVTVASHGRPEAVDACRRWAAAGKAPGSDQQTTHAAEAAAAEEGMRAAAVDGVWRRMADAMRNSVRLPVAMLTPRQESEAGSDLATIRSECARLGVAIARS